MKLLDGEPTAAAGTAESNGTKNASTEAKHTFAALFKLLGGDFVNKGILVVINILLIRRMQSDQFAAFAIMFALVQFSYQAACGVVERLYIAEHQRFRGRERATLNILMIVASVLIAGYFAGSEEWLCAIFTITCSYALASFQLSRIRFQKEERYRAFVTIDGIRTIVTLAILIPLLMAPDILHDFQAVGVIAVFATGALSADLIARSSTAIPIHPEPTSYRKVTGLLRERSALVAYSLIGALFPFVTIFLANALSSTNVIADYGVALRYQSILSMLVVATNVYLLPRLSNVESLDEAVREARRFIRYIPHVVAIVCVYIGVVWMIMPILNGHGYDSARPVFVLLGFCAASSLIATPSTNLLVRQQMYRSILLSMIAGLLVTILLSVLLIPALGYLSFAAGSLGGYLLVNGLIFARGVQVMRVADRGKSPS